MALSLSAAWSHAQSNESFVYTNRQFSLPITAFTVAPIITNYPPGSPLIVVKTISAPATSGGYHFTHWTLNGRRIDDDTGRAMNPVDVILTNNVDAIAYYVPLTNFTGDSIVPDWYKIEYYGDTSNNALSDTDGDGFDLQTEILRSYHPRLPNLLVEGGISRRRSETSLVIVDTNLVRVTALSDPVGFYSDLKVLSKGENYAIPAQPSASGFEFTGWFVGPDRVDNPQGFSLGTLTFTITNETTFVARFVRSDADTDGDGLRDGYELYHFNSLTNHLESDVDGDGFSIRVETLRSYHPNAPNELVEGGISRRRSETLLVLVDTNLARASALSDPVGFYSDFKVVTKGQSFGIPAQPPASGFEFTGWFAGAERVDNPQGFSAGTLSFTITNDVTFVARFVRSDADSDGDGLRDGYELYHFNSLTNDLDSDVDGDGFSIRVETLRSYHPNAPNQLLEGGISRRRSENMLFVPPPPEILTHPTGTNVVEGASATLSVVGKGIGQLSHQWRLNGVNLPGQTNSTLLIGSVTITNSGSYTVVVATPFGAVNSERAVVMVEAKTLEFADDFANAVVQTNRCDLGRASNLIATREAGEPAHHGKPGTNSVWLAWRPEVNGLATFSTRGSAFDTLLAVYVGMSLSSLEPVASDDDSGGFYTSSLTFAATAGVVYRIAVDGLSGERGDILFHWCLEPTSADFPRITAQPTSRTVAAGATVPFHVQVVSRDPVSYQWYFNKSPIPGAIGDTLRLFDVTEADTGSYQVSVWVGTRTNWSDTASLQIGSHANVLVKDKARDNFKLRNTGNVVLAGHGNRSKTASFASSGFDPVRVTLSQGNPHALAFSSSEFKTEPGEVNPGDKIWASTGWMFLEPATEGRAYIEARGSAGRIGLSAYAHESLDWSFGAGAEVDFDDNDNGRCFIEFPVTPGRFYSVVWASASSAPVMFNTVWTLDGTPVFGLHPNSQSVLPGASVVLSAWAAGPGNVTYQWRKDGANIAGATSATYTMANAQPGQSGAYDVVASNAAGSVTSAAATLTIGSPTAKVRGTVIYNAGSHPVPGVTIETGLSSVSPAVTGHDGSYELALATGLDKLYRLRPAKAGDDTLSNPMTTLDIALIRRHILGLQSLNNSYAIVAADVNDDRKATTLDIALIRRAILQLGSIQEPVWKFIRSDKKFESWLEPWPAQNEILDERSITNLAGNLDSQDFTAIRKGDVNGSWKPVAAQGIATQTIRSGGAGATRSSGPASRPPRLRLETAPTARGTSAKVWLRAEGFRQATSLQFTLRWDPAIWRQAAITELGLPGLSADNFGAAGAPEGMLLFSWDDPSGKGVILPEGATICALEFESAGGNSTAPIVRFSDDPVRREMSLDAVIQEMITEDTMSRSGATSVAIEIKAVLLEGAHSFGVEVKTIRGKVYLLQSTESLAAPRWKTVQEAMGDGSAIVLLDVSPRDAQRFYRVYEER